jgi:CYTH domain-containing protein
MPQTRQHNSVERERKFLVRELPAKLARYPHRTIEQGYLALPAGADAVEIRVRRAGRRDVLTVKKGRGESRLEREVPLSRDGARQLWPLTRGRRVRKVRYRIPYGDWVIELDVYAGNARGLSVAEVEFPSAASSARFRPPSWFGPEVTGQRRFANSRLAVKGWRPDRRSEG